MVPYQDSILEHYASGQFFTREYGIKGEEVHARAERKTGRPSPFSSDLAPTWEMRS